MELRVSERADTVPVRYEIGVKSPKIRRKMEDFLRHSVEYGVGKHSVEADAERRWSRFLVGVDTDESTGGGGKREALS